ncbi:FAD-dependent oxidoreductase [Ancylobacter vacuolatus]|uniref:2-polyprenyl-6-methoxyphenol hydroxylase-like FAD-dependent oxidoreductase n=1 Tax=Ancylobacter vacuolatus TaxID=223389 RepID=A0ABU0DLL8_9HYPH|nr:FAD-dependent oxidoreductase [Ancylobacter vacuolatus]MDQ0349213.1 2-polyprenyl-6-methoxyphenol hydroxylase-like FAD-dependent oxidoreductase [Ancylobacter vacuolatus]
MIEPVLIVGAGPVGLAMALELARYQVPVRIVDAMTERATTSRAVAIWPRTLELLERAGDGLSAELVGLGNKVTAANILADGQPLARVPLGEIETPYPFVLMLPQSETERVLLAHLERRGIQPELGISLADFTQEGETVTATLRHADGSEETARYAALVACDGAHSPVRHHLSLSFDGDTLGSDWAQGDFHLSGMPFPVNEFATCLHAEGPAVLFPLAPDRTRLIVGLGPSTTDAPPPPPDMAGFQALLDRRGPGGITLHDTLWSTSFRINERQVENYRVGRVFLAGDAAHVHSPAGGQGMNTGMQDAVNLAWKLALVLRGLATAPALLGSYDPERRAVGAEVIATSGRLTRMATLQNPVARHIRNAVMHVMLGLAPVQHALEGELTETAIHYRDSPLNGISWGAGPRAGDRVLPAEGEPPYGAGDTPRFTLRTGPEVGPPPGDLPAALVDPAVRPHEVAGGIQLIRPDGYLALAVAEGEWEPIVAYLHRLGPA